MCPDPPATLDIDTIFDGTPEQTYSAAQADHFSSDEVPEPGTMVLEREGFAPKRP